MPQRGEAASKGSGGRLGDLMLVPDNRPGKEEESLKRLARQVSDHLDLSLRWSASSQLCGFGHIAQLSEQPHPGPQVFLMDSKMYCFSSYFNIAEIRVQLASCGRLQNVSWVYSLK
jgi:hypothetical protein